MPNWVSKCLYRFLTCSVALLTTTDKYSGWTNRWSIKCQVPLSSPKNRWGLSFLVSSLIALVALGLAALLLPSPFPEEPAELVLPSSPSLFPAGLVLPSFASAFPEAPIVPLLGLGAALLVLGLSAVLLAAPACLLATPLALLEYFVLLQYLYPFHHNPFHLVLGSYTRLTFQRRQSIQTFKQRKR